VPGKARLGKKQRMDRDHCQVDRHCKTGQAEIVSRAQEALRVIHRTEQTHVPETPLSVTSAFRIPDSAFPIRHVTTASHWRVRTMLPDILRSLE